MSTATIRSTILRVRDEDGNWVAVPSIKGDTGPQGIQGPVGPTGPTGTYVGPEPPTNPNQLVWVDSTTSPSSYEALHNDIVTSGVHIGPTTPTTQTRIWVDTSSGTSTISDIAAYTAAANTAKLAAQASASAASASEEAAATAQDAAEIAQAAAEEAQAGAEAAYIGVQSIAATKIDKPTLVTNGELTGLTLAAQPNTRYTYGTLETLVLSFADGTTAYDETHLLWESGTTATSLTLNAENCITASFVPSANAICEIDAVWDSLKSKWVLKSSQTPTATN